MCDCFPSFLPLRVQKTDLPFLPNYTASNICSGAMPTYTIYAKTVAELGVICSNSPLPEFFESKILFVFQSPVGEHFCEILQAKQIILSSSAVKVGQQVVTFVLTIFLCRCYVDATGSNTAKQLVYIILLHWIGLPFLAQTNRVYRTNNIKGSTQCYTCFQRVVFVYKALLPNCGLTVTDWEWFGPGITMEIKRWPVAARALRVKQARVS